MAITLKRQLNESEKQQILAVHGSKCFATGHTIPDGDPIQFDHIRAYGDGGPTDLNNIAPMCETHNKEKGTLSLEDFRVKLRLRDFFATGDSLTLKDLLVYLAKSGDITAFGKRIAISELDGGVVIEHSGGRNTHAMYACPTTGWRYFYSTIPVEVLDSDDETDAKIGLQPRYLIADKVFDLYRHFQRHPVLLPSIGRVHDSRILLFDGQHKIAGLLLTGRRQFECKIYLDPDVKLLNDTNISAHDRFAQTRFYSSIMVLKLGREFGSDFERYKNLEDGSVKSEAGFMDYLDRDPAQTMGRADRNKRFRSYLYNSVLEDPENSLARYVSTANRGTDEKPLTIDMLSKSLFACFLYTEPVGDNMATDEYRRDKEISNLVAFMNMLHDLALGFWNPSAGLQDGNQRKLSRMFRSKAVMAWSELLRDAVCGKLDLQDAEDRSRPFHRDLSQSEMERIKKVVGRLVNWKMWVSPANSDIDRILADNKSAVKEWLKTHGLTTGYLMGADE